MCDIVAPWFNHPMVSAGRALAVAGQTTTAADRRVLVVAVPLTVAPHLALAGPVVAVAAAVRGQST
ncbi:MAG: hypothetical protein AAB455_01410 [Patescibacteria group bacterium]